MATHKPETVAFAQGTLDGMVEQIAANFKKSPDEGVQSAGLQLEEMWATVNTALDELRLEVETLQAKLQAVRDVLYPL